MDDFLPRALLAGLGVALVAGPLGCFVVWRRMAYFGAALAHAALLGVALGLMFDIDPNLGVLAVSIVVAALLVALGRQRHLATDTLLGILAHGTLAMGLVALAFVEDTRVDLMAYLFGDVLATSTRDLLWILGGGVLVLAALAVLWRR
ncbi:MAG: metal ABC transporter permease, partial [Alphaproteobacteria bacterium]